MTTKTGFKHNSPGPKYMLSTTIGDSCYDPTVKHPPSVVFGLRPNNISFKSSSPGPKYNVSGYGPKGKLETQAFYFGIKPSDMNYGRTIPSPLKYAPHLCPDTRHIRPPAWELGMPYYKNFKMSGPAPKYMAPPIVGANPPDLPNVPAFSILGRNAFKIAKTSSPGPGKYASTDPGLYKRRAPSAAILSRHKESTLRLQTLPGPKYHSNYNWKNEPPAYSFGMRHSMYQVIPYMREDKQPFYGF